MSISDQIPFMKKDASCHSAKMIAVDKKIIRLVQFT